jgi:F0F1-type ATP synthase membrane subunit b/b'
MELTVISLVVAFLLVIVLVMQTQLSALSRRIEEKGESISKRVDELLKEKEKNNLKLSNAQSCILSTYERACGICFLS